MHNSVLTSRELFDILIRVYLYVFNYILKCIYFSDLTHFRPLGQNQANVFVSFWKNWDTTKQK